MKTAELANELLDYWVARADRETVIIEHEQNSFAMVYRDGDFFGYISGDHVPQYAPAYDWSQGGPIIERESIATWKNGTEWRAQHPDHPDTGYYNVEDGSLDVSFYDGIAGPTPLIAAMRAFVASKFGDEVPDIKETA